MWARLAEASIPVAFHLGDSGYNAFTVDVGRRPRTSRASARANILSQVLVADRAIHDTIASLVVHGVFTRHPTLRVASIENGSDWVALLVKRLQKQANQTPWVFPEDPLDVIRRNVWVTPYYEEDLGALAELIGVERILFGSDWPHGEGLAEPTRLRQGARRLRRRRRCGRSCATTRSSCSARRRSEPVTNDASSDSTRSAPRSSPGSNEHWDPDLSVDDWWRIVAKAGWTAPHFTPEQGGRGLHRNAGNTVRADVRASSARCGRPAGSAC